MSDAEMELKHHRAKWMTDDQWECAQLFRDLFYGWHHLDGVVKEFGSGVSINTYGGRLGTFDYDGLTRLVLMAHDRMIRAYIAQGGPGRVKIILHKRHTREGSIIERHPTIEEAIAKFRGQPK